MTEYKLKENDKEEIFNIFSQRSALISLIKSFTSEDNNIILQKIMTEYYSVDKKYQDWFIQFEKNYNAVGKENGQWNVNFINGTVELK